MSRRLILLVGLLAAADAVRAANVQLKPATTDAGYIARLLINEAPFPGERGWISQADTQAAMSSILWVLHSRIHYVPQGYARAELAATASGNIIDVITAGGEKGQCDGFYRDARGQPAAVPRVHKRIEYLTGIGNEGSPGKFARLLNYGQELADAYVQGGMKEADRFAEIDRVGGTKVTGRAYSWMTDQDYYQPGGSFVRIPNDQEGRLGGNRFYTLKER